jgi:uncharacterized Ntn-hydrolase superfamily protein
MDSQVQAFHPNSVQLIHPEIRTMRTAMIPLLLVLSFVSGAAATDLRPSASVPVATYSIVAWDSVSGDLGVAVQSKFLAVGAVVPYARAGIGAIATQAWANTTYGPRGLDLLTQGMTAFQTGQMLLENDPDSGSRQVGIVDARGSAFSFSGSKCEPSSGSIEGRGYAVQGNILASTGVLIAMARTFETSQGTLAERLLNALEAGEKSGGDRRGRQSAALLVVRDRGGYGGFDDRYIDLRVDDDSLPLPELRRLYRLWERTFLIESQARAVNEFARQKNFAASQQERQRIAGVLNRMLKEKPDDPETLSNVAWMLTTYDIDRMQALELAKRAAKLAPGIPAYLHTLAECHFQLGNFDEAIAIGSELVSKDPGNDTYWRQLQAYREGKQKAGK